MKAKEWYERAQNETDTFDKFNNLWISFNNFYSSRRSISDRMKISEFITDHITEIKANEILSSCNKEISYLVSIPVIDMRGSGHDTTQNITSFLNSTTNIEKIKQILIIIYQVRCNVMHGDKSPTRDRDIQLCESSAKILELLLAGLLK